MEEVLSEETIRIVKSTAPAMKQHGYRICTTMFETLFNEHPEIASMFRKEDHTVQPGESYERQPLLVAQAVHAYAFHIDNLTALEPAIQRITHKHVFADVRPEHYQIVGEHLMQSVRLILGEAATPEVCQAWQEAYDFLAGLFIQTEARIRHSLG